MSRLHVVWLTVWAVANEAFGALRSSDGKLEASWAADKRLADKYQARMGGAKAANDFSKPSAKRRKGL